MTKSNVMEHTEFYGRHSEEDRRSFRQALRTPLLAQSPGEVADAIYNAVMSKQNEAQVRRAALPCLACCRWHLQMALLSRSSACL